MSTDVMLGIVTALLGLGSTLISLHPPTQLRGKKLAAAIFIALTCASILLIVKLSRESSATATKLEDNLRSIQQQSSEIARVETLNTELQRQLVQASASIKELAIHNVSLAQQGIQTATGGDSYCYLDIASVSKAGGLLVAVHQGKYPLYAVHARVVDLAKMKEFEQSGQKLTLDNAFSNDLNVAIGDMAVSTANPLQQITFSASDRQSFNVFFSAHNGLWTEELRFRLVNGGWTRAIRVSKIVGKKNKDIWQKVDPKYPRIMGNVDWSE